MRGPPASRARAISSNDSQASTIEACFPFLKNKYPRHYVLYGAYWQDQSPPNGKFELQGCPFGEFDPADNFSPAQQQELLTLLQNTAKSWFATEDIAYIMAGRRPNSYLLIEWYTTRALKLIYKQFDTGENQTWPLLFLMHDCPEPTYGMPPSYDQFWQLRLPRNTDNMYFVMFRLRPNPQSTSHISMLYKRSISPEEAMRAATMPIDRSSEVPASAWMTDEGYLKAARGLCSHCGAQPAKLFACSGCGIHSYCNKTCQKAERKKHKALCDLYKASRAAGRGRKAAEAEAA